VISDLPLMILFDGVHKVPSAAFLTKLKSRLVLPALENHHSTPSWTAGRGQVSMYKRGWPHAQAPSWNNKLIVLVR